MNTRKSKYRFTIFLVLIPIFLLYLQNSFVNYHSHIFANGKSITHAHPVEDCKKNAPDKSKNDSKNQIIIFHSFILDLGDSVPNFQYTDFFPSTYIKVTFPAEEIYTSTYFRKQSGRAPPVHLV